MRGGTDPAKDSFRLGKQFLNILIAPLKTKVTSSLNRDNHSKICNGIMFMSLNFVMVEP